MLVASPKDTIVRLGRAWWPLFSRQMFGLIAWIVPCLIVKSHLTILSDLLFGFFCSGWEYGSCPHCWVPAWLHGGGSALVFGVTALDVFGVWGLMASCPSLDMLVTCCFSLLLLDVIGPYCIFMTIKTPFKTKKIHTIWVRFEVQFGDAAHHRCGWHWRLHELLHMLFGCLDGVSGGLNSKPKKLGCLIIPMGLEFF